MQLGVIADDLTGATDIAVNLRAAGWSVVQVNGVPRPDLEVGAVDAVVVALKSRTVAPRDACTMSLGSLAELRRRGAKRIYFKYCSTFDSTPRGNIGPVTDALADALGAALVPTTPAYPRNQRTVYRGHLFVGDLLLSDSGMRSHPLTPMNDANLVRVLQAQTPQRVGLIALDCVEQGTEAVRQRLQTLRNDGCRHALLDAVDARHIDALGAAVVDFPLTAGGAGLASGIAAHLDARGSFQQAKLRRVEGPLVFLSGSCSKATLEQLAALPPDWPVRRLDVATLIAGADEPAQTLKWACASAGNLPVVITASAAPDDLAQAQRRFGAERAATAVEAAFRQLAVGLARNGIRRFVVAGGETSGAVVTALADELGFQALGIGAEIAPGVPWTVSVDGEPVALALKSGNFGGADFFARAAEVAP